MHFRTRAFLLTFIPLACLLGFSFLLVQGYVKHTVRIGLLNMLRQSQRQVAQLRDENNRKNARLLNSLSHDDELKAAVRMFHRDSSDPAPVTADSAALPVESVPLALGAQSTLPDGSPNPEDAAPVTGTLQEQILRFGVKSGVDFIMVTAPDGTPMAGAARAGGDSAELVPLFVFPQLSQGDLLLFRGEPFQTGVAPIESNGVKLGSLILGEQLHPSVFATSSVLLHHDWIMQSDIDKNRISEIGTKLHQCSRAYSECTMGLSGVEWLVMPILSNGADSDWTFYSIVDVDDSLRPVESALRHIFFTVLLMSLVTALVCSVVWSREIVRPIAAMVSHLHSATKTGRLPEFEVSPVTIREMRDLEKSFNDAAASVRKAHGDLTDAYLQFVYSLANALDARDCYTAGHSKRVSDLSCAIATTMGRSEDEVERLRVGALLHDIGKIGIPDAVLQYPGKLSNEDFNTIKTHPLIGRRILQSVEGFAIYLPAVELHHENWDGSGYPRHNVRDETPLDARIVHVADAYDAMTSDRAYRNGMGHERAMQILAENAGTQFDPDVVATLFEIASSAKFSRTTTDSTLLTGNPNLAMSNRTTEPVPINMRTKIQGPVAVPASKGRESAA